MPPEETQDAAAKARHRRSTADVWNDPESLATTLLAAFIDEFGTEAFQWHPATIRLEVEETFGVSLTEAAFAKLMAGIALLTTDDFAQKVPDFCTITNALHGIPPGDFDPPDAAEIAWAITESLLLDPDQEEPFSLAVRHFIGDILEMEGIDDPPDVLRVGLRDRVPAAPEFSDPAIAAQARAVETKKREEVTDVVRTKLSALMDQLERLPLQNGNAAELVGRLRKNLPQGDPPTDGSLPQAHEAR